MRAFLSGILSRLADQRTCIFLIPHRKLPSCSPGCLDERRKSIFLRIPGRSILIKIYACLLPSILMQWIWTFLVIVCLLGKWQVNGEYQSSFLYSEVNFDKHMQFDLYALKYYAAYLDFGYSVSVRELANGWRELVFLRIQVNFDKGI